MTPDETVDQAYKHPYEHFSSQKKGNNSCFLMEEGSRQHNLRHILAKIWFQIKPIDLTTNSQEIQREMNILKDTTGMQLVISPQESMDKDPVSSTNKIARKKMTQVYM